MCDTIHSWETWYVDVWHDTFEYVSTLCLFVCPGDTTNSYVIWPIWVWNDSCRRDIISSCVILFIIYWGSSLQNGQHLSRCDRTTTRGGDQTFNITISRSPSFPGFSFEWRGLRLLPWKLLWDFGDSHKTCLKVTGTPVKMCLKCWQSKLFEVWSPPPVVELECLRQHVRRCDITDTYITWFIQMSWLIDM